MPQEDQTTNERPSDEAGATKRSAIFGRRRIAAVLVAVGGTIVVGLLVLVVLYQTGVTDSYIKGQFVEAFDELGIGLAADRFEVSVFPLTMTVENAVFTNKNNGERIGAIRNARFGMTILDLFALDTIRNVSIDSADVYGLEIWIRFDENGDSNFKGIKLKPPQGRVRFQYEAARVTVRDSAVHFGEMTRRISANAEDLALGLVPAGKGDEDGYRFDLSTSSTDFSYGDEKVEPIAIRGKGLLSEKGIDVEAFAIGSELGDATLSGKIVGWSSPEYSFTVVSEFDLAGISDVFPLGTAVTGNGGFTGKITGRGEKYRIEGEAASESLAADNVRLKALKISASASGEGSMYEANGKAIAELLTFEEFRLDYPQLTGNIRGTGTDFKWLGALEAAAFTSPLGTVGSLYVNDAVAEYRDQRLLATLNGVTARKFTSTDAYLESITTPSIRIISSGGLTTTSVERASAARLDAEGATLTGVDINGIEIESRENLTNIDALDVQVDELRTREARLRNVTAGDIRVENRDGTTSIRAGRVNSERTEAGGANLDGALAENVEVEVRGDNTDVFVPQLRVAKVTADAAVLANLNIAGVRLSVRKGVISGTTSDFKPGTVDLRGNGQLEDVSVFKPVFVLEPSGRYRASLDMTLGRGLIGKVDLGAARASVIAENDKITLNNISAEVMNGSVSGNAVIADKEDERSVVVADFTDLDLAKLLAIQSGNVLPLEGKASGRADLSFAGTNFRRATGELRASVSGTAGNSERGFLPVTGRMNVTADDGLLTLDSLLSTDSSRVSANGELDLYRDGSDLGLLVDSSDAGEIERVFRIFELSPQLSEQLEAVDGHFAGEFSFDGRLTGNVEDPRVRGRATLGSVMASGRDLGSLSANFDISSQGTSITDGLLREQAGGTLTFSASIPSGGTNNTSVTASLDKFNIGTLLSAVPIRSLPASFRDLRARTSGELDLSGLPNAMTGSASLDAEAGTLNGETFDSLSTRVNFDGSLVNVESFNARFGEGELTAEGRYNTEIKIFYLDAKGTAVPVSRLLAFLPPDSSVPDADGTLDINAAISGAIDDTSTWEADFGGRSDQLLINGNSFGAVSFNGKTSRDILTATLTSRVGGGEQVINATADLGNERVPFRASTTLSNTLLKPFIEIFRKPGPDQVAIAGSASGDIVLAGDLVGRDADNKEVFTTSLLKGSAELSKFELTIGETPLQATNQVRLTFDTDQVTVDNARLSGGGTNLVVNGTKALADDAINNLTMNGRMDLRVLNALAGDFFFSGLADVEVTLTGVNKNVRLNGRSRVERGSFSTFIGTDRISLEALSGCVLFNASQVQIGCNDGGPLTNEIRGRLGGGEVRMSGEIVLTDALEIDMFRIDMSGVNIRAPIPTGFSTTGNAELTVSGRRQNDGVRSLISGNIFARRSTYQRDIDIADFISGRSDASISRASDDSSILSRTRLDIRVLGRDALVVRNNIADLTASADLRILGDVETPQISGRIIANGGTIFFRDDRYEIQRGTLTFPPNTTIEPVINLQAESDIAGYQVFVTLSGNLADAESLTATLRSNPALPQADVVSLITTGSLANTGGGIPTYAQSGLNTAAEILTDEIINKPITRATDRLFGLNRFTLDPIVSGQRGNPTARLTVGRQINRNLLVTYSTNLSQDQNQVIALEYRVSNRLSFVAQYEQRALSNVTRNRNSFNFEIRLRKRF